MHRFFLPTARMQQDELVLEGPEAHHASRVLRLGAGDLLTILDGVGNEYSCRITRASRGDVAFVVENHQTHPRGWEITLLQAVPKGKTFEGIIQKATELGAARIVPLLTEHTIVQLTGRDASEKQARWRQTAIEAMKQCGAPWLPEVRLPQSPQAWLNQREPCDLAFVGSLHDAPRHPRHWFEHYYNKHGQPPQRMEIWIGPEGDFTVEEIRGIKAAGARPISLGPLILRTDTAALYTLSVVSSELQYRAQPADA